MAAVVPLDKRTGVNNEGAVISMIDAHWTTEIFFLPYAAYHPGNVTTAEKEQRMNALRIIVDDTLWLLRQPHYIFWSQMVFDESLHHFITTYLQCAPRAHNGSLQYLKGDSPLANLERQLHRNVFMILLRLSTYRETKKDVLTPSVFGDILYENWLIDVPMMLDIAAIYGRANRDLVSKMFANVFKHQPKYHDDLDAALGTIVTEMLDKVVQHIEDEKTRINSDTEATARDVVEYVIDITATLHAFIDVHGSMREGRAAYAMRRLRFIEALAKTYEVCLGFVENKITSDAGQSLKQNCQQWCLLLVHTLFETCYCQTTPTADGQDDRPLLELLDAMVDQHERFFRDWSTTCALSQALTKARAADTSLDADRMSYLEAIVRTHCDEFDAAHVAGDNVGAPARAGETRSAPKGKEPARVASGAAGAGTTPLETLSLVSAVKDLLPDLGDGFVAACLQAFGNDPSRVINGVLETALPPDVCDLSRGMTLAEWEQMQHGQHDIHHASPHTGVAVVEPSAGAAPTRSLLSDRHNVYDGDAFDVFAGGKKSLDASQVRYGKKAESNAKDVLDDKTLVKARFEEFLESQYEYEDEYDDTYDEMGGGPGASAGGAPTDGGGSGAGKRSSATHAPAATPRVGPGGRGVGVGVFTTENIDYVDVDDASVYLPPALPAPNRNREQGKQRHIGWHAWEGDDDDSDADAEAAGETGASGHAGTSTHPDTGAMGGTAGDAKGERSKVGRGFGPDAPGKGRGGRGGGRGRGRGGRGQEEKPRVDLTVRTTESLRARSLKDKNKAARANHNRRKGADSKMNKGMF